jgi:hypothetical protein
VRENDTLPVKLPYRNCLPCGPLWMTQGYWTKSELWSEGRGECPNILSATGRLHLYRCATRRGAGTKCDKAMGARSVEKGEGGDGGSVDPVPFQLDSEIG